MCEICRQRICPSHCPNANEGEAIKRCARCDDAIQKEDEYYDIFGDAYCICCGEERFLRRA